MINKLKKISVMIFLAAISYQAKSQLFVGKPYIDVHKKMISLKGENLNAFIEAEKSALNFGFINNAKKTKIYKYSAIFNSDEICTAELWSNFKTKDEAMNAIKRNIGNKKITYISTTDEAGDLYLLKTNNLNYKININYMEDGYKEYIVSFSTYN